jgi:hypothetical protein
VSVPLLEEMHKKELERALYIKARARAKLQEASLPPRMQAHALAGVSWDGGARVAV